LRLVLDCNVLIAAARTEGTCRRAVTRAVADHIVVVSRTVLEEYAEVGARPKHRPYRLAMRAILDELVGAAMLVAPAAVFFGLPDPDDEIYLATALAGEADALVTGNLRHFPQEACGGVEILSPRMFLDRVATGTAQAF
jgi:uncharacterized protein